MNKVRTTLVIAALAITGGCYKYVPASRADVVPGATYRARLTDAGADEMRRYFGPNVLSVEGPLVSWDGEGLALLTETTMQREGFPPTFVIDTIQLLPHYLAGVDFQKLDGKRTAGFTAAIVAGAVGTIVATRVFGGSSEGEGGVPDPEALLLFSIPLRILFRW